MRVTLLHHTHDPERIVAQAAKLCYSPSTIEAIGERLSPETVRDFIERLISLGHFSALEHAVFGFGIEGVSRALTHQLVRHRLASYSQQSQRYVRFQHLEYVVPPSIQAHSGLAAEYQQTMDKLAALYQTCLEQGIAAEDARYLLPNACETKIVVTMNARELRHFFQLRCCQRAQWEIRLLADAMLQCVRPLAPNVFAGTGPACVSGACSEGSMSCGRQRAMREKYRGRALPIPEEPAIAKH
jgi:thymidylate synthase (FAD)